MSQPRPGVVSRKEAVDSLREIINKDTWQGIDNKWKRELSRGLKDFAAKYFELSHKEQDGDRLWHKYFVWSLHDIWRDLPASTADLRKAAHELAYRNGNAAKGNPASPAASSASPATLSATPRTDVNNKKKRPATEQDDMNTPSKTKRVKTEADATNFTVYAKGPYTVRVFEGGILSAEFSSSTPATVSVKMVPGSAAASAAAVVNCDESDN